MLKKITLQEVEWECHCGKKNVTSVADMKVEVKQVKVGDCKCGLTCAVLLAGVVSDIPNRSRAAMIKHRMNQTLGKMLIAQRLVNEDFPPVEGCADMGIEMADSDVVVPKQFAGE